MKAMLPRLQADATRAPFTRIGFIVRMPGYTDDPAEQVAASARKVIFDRLITFPLAGRAAIITRQSRRFT